MQDDAFIPPVPPRRESLLESGRKAGWHWLNIWCMASMHALAVLAFVPAFFHWSVIPVMLAMFWIVGGLGVCLGYHRLLTHRSFKTSGVIRYGLATFGSLSFQGSPLQWIGTHRIHHSDSDGPDDPHSPEHGFTWSHILWCFYKHPEGLDPMDYTRDLQRDRSMLLLEKFFYVPQIILAGMLFALGWWLVGSWQIGMGWVVWGIGVRTIVLYHATWFVNSAAHTWGYRNFDTTDGSKNNWWVAILSFGEGWHNNHHAQQRSAAHGMRWFELDPTWWTILIMERVGLASQVVRPKLPDQESRSDEPPTAA